VLTENAFVLSVLELHAVIKRQLNQMDMKVSIGVTTGDAYCGSVGNETRCEYAIVGDCVNLR